MNDKLKKMLRLHEGIRLFPYQCTAGKLTIGVGRNLEARGISPAEAEYLLDNDIEEVLGHCAKLVYWKRLDEARRCIVADMVFNLGFAAFCGFRKLNAALEKRDYTLAAYEMRNSKWFVQVGARGRRLSDAMKSGELNF
jgi:lysozyme